MTRKGSVAGSTTDKRPIRTRLWSWITNHAELISTSILAIATIFLVLATYSLRDVAAKTDESTARQVALLDKVSKVVQDQVQLLQRNSFDQALEDAERYCTGCSEGSPNYMIAIPLEKAVQVEPGAATLLVAAEYNRLAMLGASVWDFERTKLYADKALACSKIPLDLFFSNLLLGHIHFSHLGSDPDHATSNTARQYFRTAIGHLEQRSGSENGQLLLGKAHGLWAQHEAFLKNEKECQYHRDQARSTWSNRNDSGALLVELDMRIDAAKGGRRPEISCLFGRSEGACSPVPAPAGPRAAPAPPAPPAAPAKTTPAPPGK